MSLGSWKDKLKEAKDEKMSSVQDTVMMQEKASSITPNMDTVKRNSDTLTELNAINLFLKIMALRLLVNTNFHSTFRNIILDCDGNNVGLKQQCKSLVNLPRFKPP